jgi:pimeloyl-ACP methyl ester carboxylesterase
MKLNYRRHGAGEPLLLLHGIGADLRVWDPVLGDLASCFDVIAVDLPGFGRSDPLPDGGAPTAVALAKALAELLDDFSLVRVHVVGNSLGGWVALELGVSDRALSVVGLCPAGLWAAPRLHGEAIYRGRAHRVARRLRPLLPLLMLSPGVRRAVLRPFVASPEAVPYRAATRMVLSYGRSTAYDATATAMRRGSFSPHAALQIEVPVTLAFGELDPLIQPARIPAPGARTVILPGCGHIPMWDDPALVLEVITSTIASARSAPVATENGR